MVVREFVGIREVRSGAEIGDIQRQLVFGKTYSAPDLRCHWQPPSSDVLNV